MARNAWTDQQLALDYHAGDATQAALIRAENEIGGDALTCGKCGNEAHYKHTIGTHKCIACGALWLQPDWV